MSNTFFHAGDKFSKGGFAPLSLRLLQKFSHASFTRTIQVILKAFERTENVKIVHGKASLSFLSIKSSFCKT